MTGWSLLKEKLNAKREKLKKKKPPKMQEIVENALLAESKPTTPVNVGKKKTKKPVCRTSMGDYIVPPGGKPLSSLGDSRPGPADYFPDYNLTKCAAAKYSIVGRPNIIDADLPLQRGILLSSGKGYIPAPMDYDTSGDVSWKNKKITLQGRGKNSYFDKPNDISTHLLGKYKVKYRAIGTEGYKFKLGIKAKSCTGPPNKAVQPVDTQGFQAPPPNYRPNSGYWGRGLKKSFGCRLPLKAQERPGPGPGDYHVKDTNHGPSHSIGINFTQQVESKLSPAANTYDIGTTIGKGLAKTIGARIDTVKVKKGPCPSAYCTYVRDYDQYKNVALKYRWFEPKDPPKQPGPADYAAENVNLKSNPPRYTCRPRVKKIEAVNDNPGPGAYDAGQDFADNGKPSFSFKQRLNPPANNRHFPGPNVYEVENREKAGSKKAPAFSMAKRFDPPNCMQNIPGPGKYLPNLIKTDMGKYTMTKKAKAGKFTFVTPAPNAYIPPEDISAKNKGVVFKSRPSPYVYSGYNSTKLEDARFSLPVQTN